MFAI
jgi:hypothetical protein